MTSDSPRTDAGESLIELLVAIAILGIAVTAILGGVMMATDTSSLHQKQANSQNQVRNWAESVSGSTYTACATPGQVATAASVPAAAVVKVQYWNTSTNAFQDACPGTGDTGLQKVTLTSTNPAGGYIAWDQTLNVIHRNPCESAC